MSRHDHSADTDTDTDEGIVDDQRDDRDQDMDMAQKQGQSHDQDQAIGFDEGIQEAAKEFEVTKTRTYDVPGTDGATWEFEIKKMTGAERGKVKRAGAKQQRRSSAGRSGDLDVDEVQREILRQGIVDGPPGFETTDQNLRDLMENTPEIADDLVDAIENFSELDEDDEQGF